MKNKKVFAVGLVLSLVLLLGIGFFSNYKKSKEEVDLSIAAPVMRTYAVEKYDLNIFTQVSYNNQRKIIKIDIFEKGAYDKILGYDEKTYKEYIEDLCNMSLDIKKVANKFLDRNDINISIRIINDQDGWETYLINIVNGKVDFSFKTKE